MCKVLFGFVSLLSLVIVSLFGSPNQVNSETRGRLQDGTYYCYVSDYLFEGRAALPDDTGDDTHQIQLAINDCQFAEFSVATPRVVVFSRGTYLLDSDNLQKSLVVSGTHDGQPLRIQGNSAELRRVLRKSVGYWADLLVVRGFEAEPITCEQWKDASKKRCVKKRVPSFRLYPLAADAFSLTRGAPFAGTSRPAQNIEIADLRLTFAWVGGQPLPPRIANCKSADARFCVNGIGIVYGSGITLKNVTIEDAPQAAFAFVSASPERTVQRAVCDNCSIVRAGSEGFRVHAWEANTPLDVTIRNSSSLEIQSTCRGRDANVKGRKVHLWYMPFLNNGIFSDPIAPPPAKLAAQSLRLENVYFDESAEVVATQGVYNLSIKQSTIKGGMTLLGLTQEQMERIRRGLNRPIVQDSSFEMADNTFDCRYWNNQSLRVPRAALYLRDLLGGKLSLSQFIGGLPEDMSSCYRQIQLSTYRIETF